MIYTNLSIFVCVSDRVNLRSGSTSNFYIFLYFYFSNLTNLKRPFYIGLHKIYLIIKLKKCGYFHQK